MQLDIAKLCADSLRVLSYENHEIKLKAAHAHELVAAHFGYKSRNAMLADTKYPISNLDQAEIIVMTPDDFISQRRKDLQGLSSELPDNYSLGEAFYECLFSQKLWVSNYPPFKSFEKMAGFIVENNDAYQEVYKFYRDIPMHHIVDVKDEENAVLLSVIHAHQTSAGEMQGVGETTIKLPRVAGRIGYGNPQMRVVKWSGDYLRTLKFNGAKS